MTTTVKVIANHGWPVEVTPKDKFGQICGPVSIVEPNEEREFFVFDTQDLHIHEVQPNEPPPNERMDFGAALKALKAGAAVARSGWNGKGMWIALTPGSAFEARHAKCGHAAAKRAVELPDGEAEIELLPHIDMRAADGSMVVGWLASQTDMLAEDWAIVSPAPAEG